MGETIDARIAFLQRQLHAITLATQQAQARDDTVAVATLRELFAKLAKEVETLKIEAHANDAPSALLVTLDNFGDEVAATGKSLGLAVVNVAAGAAAFIRYLPAIVLVGLLVVGLIYAGKLRKEL